VKFGFEYSDNEVYNFFLQDAWGNYSFDGLDAFRRGEYFDYDLNTNPGNPGAIAAAYSNRSLGVFLQDTWYVNPNLTLTLGVRADKPSTDSDPQYNACFAAAPGAADVAACGTGHTGGFGRDNTNTYGGDFLVQPRFGFNYAFDSERLMQLRGGVGLFQGDAPQVWVSNAYQSTGLNYVSYQNLSDWETVRFSPDGLNQNVPSTPGAAVRNVNVIADDFELPSVWKANLVLVVETPWYGIVASGEILISDVNNGLFYNSLNIGPGYQGPDGRALFWNPAAGNFASTRDNRFGRNAYF